MRTAALLVMLAGCLLDQSKHVDALKVVDALPAADASNVRRNAPIWIRFSAPVDAATLDAAITITSGGSPLERTATVQADFPEVVVVRLAAAPGTGSMVEVAISDALRSAGGAAFAGTSWSYTIPTWYAMVQPREATTAVVVKPPVVAIDARGMPAIAWTEGNGAVLSWAASELAQPWVPSGAFNRRALTPAVDYELAFDVDGRVNCAWTENEGGSTRALVAARNSNIVDLEFMPPDLTTPIVDFSVVTHHRLRRRGTTLFVAYLLSGITACPWNEAMKKWVPCLPMLNTGGTYDFDLGFAGDKPLLAEQAFSGDLFVHRLDGTAWTRSIPVQRMYQIKEPRIAAAPDGVDVAWIERDTTSRLYVSHVALSDLAIVPLGGGLETAGFDASSPAIARSAQGELFVAWREQDAAKTQTRAALAVWTGSAWQRLDPIPDTAIGTSVDSVALAVEPAGNPIVVFAGGPTGGEIRAAWWNARP